MFATIGARRGRNPTLGACVCKASGSNKTNDVEDNRMRTIKMLSILPVLAIGFGLSACGHTEGDRAITGGALGAGAGALGGAMVGHPVGGALVGGAAGAAAGALTDSDDINFGKPIWKW
jgi:hypothetical protein